MNEDIVPDKVTYRSATPADAERIAALHVKVWRQTYSEIAPQPAVDALNEARRLAYWQERLAPRSSGTWTLIAAQKDWMLGFVCFGAATHQVFGDCGEIKHLYVDQSAQGCGVGRRLLELALGELADNNFDRAALAVVRANQSAKIFYQRMGGRTAGRFTDAGPIWRSVNDIYEWELPPLNSGQA